MDFIVDLEEMENKIKTIKSNVTTTEKLKEKNNQLYELKTENQGNKNYMEEFKESIKELKDKILSEILGELDDKLKPVYSNEKKREIELNNRLKNNSEYIALFNKYKVLKQKSQMDDFLIEKLENELKIMYIEYNDNTNISKQLERIGDILENKNGEK